MSNLHPGDQVSPSEAGRLLSQQAARIASRRTVRDEARDALRVTSDEGLLSAFARLTHRIHQATRQRDKDLEQDLRAQRDLVKGEILRRMQRG